MFRVTTLKLNQRKKILRNDKQINHKFMTFKRLQPYIYELLEDAKFAIDHLIKSTRYALITPSISYAHFIANILFF